MTTDNFFDDAQTGLEKRLAKIAINTSEDISEKQTIYQNRISYELDVITSMGFEGYFLIVADFIVGLNKIIFRWDLDEDQVRDHWSLITRYY